MEYGWHSRLYLPHFEAGEQAQFVTFRLADALPPPLVEQWRSELLQLERISKLQAAEPAACQQKREDLLVTLNRRIEAYLDKGYGEALLRDARLATIVENTLLFFDAQRYSLHACIVMPNHVHVLFTPASGWFLSQILHSWKSFTSHEIGKLQDRSGTIWEREYFDRMIRSEKHYAWTVDYIEENPVKAGLCAKREDWVFSSARRRAGKEALGAE